MAVVRAPGSPARKRGIGSGPRWPLRPRSLSSTAGEPVSESSESPAASGCVPRPARTSVTTSSRTRATPIVALSRAALRSWADATARTEGCRSGGYHLPSEASHHRSPWRSSLKSLLNCPEMSRLSVTIKVTPTRLHRPKKHHWRHFSCPPPRQHKQYSPQSGALEHVQGTDADRLVRPGSARRHPGKFLPCEPFCPYTTRWAS